MPDAGPVGRQAELSRVEAFLDDVPSGLRALTIAGPAGIGKTTVWEAGVRQAESRGWTVLSARPSGAEAQLSFAALADLLDPIDPAALDELPPIQRRAVDVAPLRADAGGQPLDRHAVSAGLLTLLRTFAGPLLVAIDDAQWLDAATADVVAFALRRLAGRPVGVLVSVRDEGERAPTFERSLPSGTRDEIELDGLGVAALHAVLKREIGRSFPRPVLVRIVAATGGNPFYALEIARELEREGLPAAGARLPVPPEVRTLTRRRLARLPAETLEALLVAASLSRPTTALVDVAALAPAEDAAIVRVGEDGRIRFGHPILASAVYESASADRRRRVHRALAERLPDPEERARHLALAETGPDEETAEALDRAVELVATRGAAEAAVTLKQLALRMTPADDQQALARRRQELAERLYFAGDPAGARRELEPLADALHAGEQRAGALLDLGSVIWAQGDVDGGTALLSQALEEAESPSLRARIHSRSALMADDCDVGLEHAAAALALIDERADPLLYSFALHNEARFRLYARGEADHEAIERGMRLQREAAAWEVSVVPAYWARDFDQFDTARARFEDLLRVFREHRRRSPQLRGARASGGDRSDDRQEGSRPRVRPRRRWSWPSRPSRRPGATSPSGREGRSAYVVASSRRRARPARRCCAGSRSIPTARSSAWRETYSVSSALARSDVEEADRQLALADAADEALHVREPASERFQADHAEAVVALGDLERAERLVQRLELRAERLPRPWICAVAARSRGLLASARGDLDDALSALEAALAHHDKLQMPLERGRTLLALGQLLRRRKERRKARSALQEALGLFEDAGAPHWAERARAELRRVPVRRAPADLTATEETIARLAAGGLTNRAIAERIYVSPKTVESNLGRVYRKLGIRSRAELGRVMAEREGVAET